MTEVLGTASGTLPSPYSSEVVELALLLSSGQAADLEAAAFQRGATAGELVRRLVREFLKAEKAATSSDPRLFR